MAPAQPEQLARIVEFLQEERRDLSLDDVMALAERMAETLDDTVARVDTLLHDEFRSIVGEIAGLRREIGAIRPAHMRFDKIPEAGRELDAVVEATETATNAIMEAAEGIMAADASDPEAYKAFVDDKMLVIFEACSFQDITGQRIAKVAEAMSQLEGRLARFSAAVKARDAAGIDESEADRRKRNESLLLNGPQMGGPATAQDAIDALFA